MENYICENQNKEENVNKLKAAHNLYSEVGLLTGLYILFCVLFPVVVSFGRFFIHEEDKLLSNFLITYSFISLILGFIFDHYINKIRNKASLIQQLFDCEVLGLEWNYFLFGDKPSQEDINNNSRNNEGGKFRDWYEPNVKFVDKNIAVLLCQRITLSYDIGLRKVICNTLTFLSDVLLVLIIGISFYYNENIQDVLVYVGVPLVPLLRWQFITKKSNMDDLRRCDSLKKQIDLLLDHIDITKTHTLTSEIQQIQDCIYLHRKTVFKIPDWIYNIMRKKLEVRTYHLIKTVITRYKH